MNIQLGIHAYVVSNLYCMNNGITERSRYVQKHLKITWIKAQRFGNVGQWKMAK